MMSLVLQRRLVRLPLHARVASARNYPRHINVTRVLAEEAKERKPSFIGSIGQRFGRLVETIHERSAQRQVVAVMISILMARKSDATVHEKIIPDPKLRGTMLKMGRKLLVEGKQYPNRNLGDVFSNARAQEQLFQTDMAMRLTGIDPFAAFVEVRRIELAAAAEKLCAALYGKEPYGPAVAKKLQEEMRSTRAEMLRLGKDPYNATNDDFYKSPIVATTRNMVSVFKEQGFDEDVATVALHAFVRYGLYFPDSRLRFCFIAICATKCLSLTRQELEVLIPTANLRQMLTKTGKLLKGGASELLFTDPDAAMQVILRDQQVLVQLDMIDMSLRSAKIGPQSIANAIIGAKREKIKAAPRLFAMLARTVDPLLKTIRRYRYRNATRDTPHKVPNLQKAQVAFDKPGKAFLTKLAVQHPELRKAMIKAAKKDNGPERKNSKLMTQVERLRTAEGVDKAVVMATIALLRDGKLKP